MRIFILLLFTSILSSCFYNSSHKINKNALSLIDKNDYNQALVEVNQGISQNPSLGELYYTRSIIYMKISEFDKAINDMSYFIDRFTLDSNKYSSRINNFLMRDFPVRHLAEAFYYRGLQNHKLLNYDNALKDYIKSLNLGFKSSALYFNIAIIMHKKGFYNSAIRNYSKSIAIDSTGICLYNRGVAFMELGKYNNADIDLKKSLKLGYRKADKIVSYIK